MDKLNRRGFIAKSGVTAAAAGGLWLAPQIITSNPAFAGVSCAREETVSFSTFGSNGVWGGQSYPLVGSYPALTVVAGTAVAIGNPTGLSNNGQLQNTARQGMPTTRNFQWHMQNADLDEGFRTTFSFTQNVWNVRFTIYDIDLSNGGTDGTFTDKVYVTATANAPDPLTPAASVTARSTVAPLITGTGTTAANALTGTGDITTWTGNAANLAPNAGWASFQILGPLRTFTLNYLSGRNGGTEQYIAMGNITFCR